MEVNYIDTRQNIKEETDSKASTADSDSDLDSQSESEHEESALDEDYRSDGSPDNDGVQTWLNIVRKKQERKKGMRGKKKPKLHLKFLLLNVISVQAHNANKRR